MAEQEKKQKVIIREIKPKVRIIEAGEDKGKVTSEETAGVIDEESLEALTEDAPSAREFPEFAGQRAGAPEQIRQQETEVQTPAATTEAESSPRGVYQIQQNVTEKEIGRLYKSETGQTGRAVTSREVIPIRADDTGMLRSRERELARGPETEEEKYKISIEPGQPIKKRKYPWEA